MPNPKRRFSHQRTALRRTNYKAVLPEIEQNKQVGGEPFKLRNMASPEGYYKGRRLPGYKD
ncbi:MAG: 50S ribosomal protein L32 [Armatimonadetes bacterium 55-13]|nr:50S ribosomal protein L32 [Armatimonadota bacterium]OJU65099.1 MAG: 50S ribosomal protein L32 [Armatimonadetes bacterium 55-13]